MAQYLEPGGITFDLLLVDEASQVSPVDALGAMARARQVVVVGDSKQLPPTRFFSKMLDDDGAPDDDDSAFNAANLDSILGLCVSQGLPQRMLRWHYRSRHHSLIAVSNREFYGSQLFVVPSPTTMTAINGLHFRFVKDGVFDRGGTRTNRVEAQEIARAVIDHARKSPRKSLGVGAFSVSQRDAIRDELELLLRQETGLDEFFASGRPEPFFVKNLENIQGDERDVIFISVGYARDASGYMAMNFGPLSIEGGERRLNVLITRARERCEVFSSITADDIDLQGARSRGASAFKTFLRFAATGILDDPQPTGRDARLGLRTTGGRGPGRTRPRGPSPGGDVGLHHRPGGRRSRLPGSLPARHRVRRRNLSFRARPAIAIDCARASCGIAAGGFIGSGAPIGSTGPTSSSGSSSRRSTRLVSTPKRKPRTSPG